MSGRIPLRKPMQPPKYSVTHCGGGVNPNGVSYPGGLDLTTPTLSLQPGALRDCLNFECAQSGGYSRIEGYERFDGHESPSSASYSLIQLTSFVNVPTVGQTITQAVSGATAVIAAINLSPSYLVVTQVSGVFDTTHNISVSATLIGTATPLMVSVSAQQNAQYIAAAADIYRADIGAVPGSGPVLGVVAMTFSGSDNVYAFRANGGGTATLIYKATVSGWQLVPLLNTVAFTSGSHSGTDYEPPDGVTLTQGGVTATVKRVMWQGGTFTGATAVGTLVIDNPAGGNFASGAATLSDTTTLTLSGIQTAITLQPGGKYQFVKANFSGQLATRRIYGCDGANQAFEFDGEVYAPIATGDDPDTPTFIVAHKNFLILAQSSSIIYSGAGTPFKWDSTDGGGEIATGDAVTGLITLPGSQSTATLAVFLRNNTAFLYGTDPTTFNYVTFNTGLGALPYSVQNLFDTFFFDALGMVTLKTTLNWGNFLPNALTKNIQPFIIQERTKLVESTFNRSKSQYRVFFNDGYGLYLTMINQQYLGVGVVKFPNPVNCVDETIDSVGNEISYFGSSDGNGYVYQLDIGTSFDGANIDAAITLAWDALKSPRILKQFRAGSIEIQSDSYVTLNFGYKLGYDSLLVAQPGNVAYSTDFSAAQFWDSSFTWDAGFVWDGQSLTPTEVDMTGTAENIQFSISSSTNYIGAYTIGSVITHYSMRRGIRV